MPLWPLDPPPVIHLSLDERPTDLRQVHLYFADLDQEAWDGRWDPSVISAEEQGKADRIADDLPRTRYAVGRAITRHVLARAVDVAPADLRFDRNDFGKPVLGEEWVAVPRSVHFNVSHREHAFLLGLSGRGELGVDVELLKPIPDIERVAEDHLPPARVRAIKDSAPGRKLAEFYRAWTLEEAVAKATGLGATGMGRRAPQTSSGLSPLILVWQTEARVGGMAVIASVALITISADAMP